MANQLYETLKRTTLAHVKAYESPKPWDSEAIQQLRVPGCFHFLHPTQSMPEQYAGPIDHDMHVGAMTFLGAAIDRCVLEVKDIVVDVQNRTTVVRLLGTYDFKAAGDEPAEKDWKVDYMWLSQMNEDGSKIVRVEEFLDHDRTLKHCSEKAQQYAAMQST